MPLRLKVVHDPEPEHALHDPNGDPLPGSRKVYEENQITALINPADDPVTGKRRPVPWSEYLEYYGNPDRHVVCGVIVERQCTACGHYEHAGSLWGIDFMDDDKEAAEIGGGWLTEAEALALPGYLADVCKDLIAEASKDELVLPPAVNAAIAASVVAEAGGQS